MVPVNQDGRVALMEQNVRPDLTHLTRNSLVRLAGGSGTRAPGVMTITMERTIKAFRPVLTGRGVRLPHSKSDDSNRGITCGDPSRIPNYVTGSLEHMTQCAQACD
jgi:hypothetical protein